MAAKDEILDYNPQKFVSCAAGGQFKTYDGQK